MKTIIIFIIIFGLLVLVHEFGHYYFARKSGILVREFSIGMGPKLFATRKNGTTYTIRWLPLGGYVRMAGAADDEAELDAGTMATLIFDANHKVQTINTSDKIVSTDGIPFQISKTDLEHELYVEGYENGDESELKHFAVNHDATIIEKDGTEVQIAPIDVQFQSASIPKRMITNFAGPMNNFIFAILVFILFAFVRGGVPSNANVVGQIVPNSPAAKANVETGDIIEKIQGHQVKSFTEASTLISKRANKVTAVMINRNGHRQNIQITPKTVTVNKKKVGQIGIGQPVDTSVGAKVSYGWTGFVGISSQIFQVLGKMLTGHFSLNQLAGPVGIYTMTSQFAANGFASILYFLAYLSVNLGIINLIPIPALDGGKLILNIIEGIRGKPIPQEKEAIVTLIGAGILVLLMVAVTFNDFQRIFQR
ncbi:RIP metalloprotease RseP [Lactobacillus sp. CC-MHH1034]|uniref:RIP metalloprotease RseP n=1 Tax=Agrilactobacillus fermenti TaxID=2586909 RepID=UPI001E333B76|nr:RIP metalloprotease RseP [Agrilactobacillus fermenti]MCD2256255.1 RIP metalloprotease RseP [Agrilactobacillus fermenti]